MNHNAVFLCCPDQYPPQYGVRKVTQKVDNVFEDYEGRVIAVDESVTELEGKWPLEQNVMIEFPTERDLLDRYESYAYQSIVVHRKKSTEANVIILNERQP